MEKPLPEGNTPMPRSIALIPLLGFLSLWLLIIVGSVINTEGPGRITIIIFGLIFTPVIIFMGKTLYDLMIKVGIKH